MLDTDIYLRVCCRWQGLMQTTVQACSRFLHHQQVTMLWECWEHCSYHDLYSWKALLELARPVL